MNKKRVLKLVLQLKKATTPTWKFNDIQIWYNSFPEKYSPSQEKKLYLIQLSIYLSVQVFNDPFV